MTRKRAGMVGWMSGSAARAWLGGVNIAQWSPGTVLRRGDERVLHLPRHGGERRNPNQGKCRSPVLSWGEVRSAHHPISICTFLAPPMEPAYLDRASCRRSGARPNASSTGARCGSRDRRRPSTWSGRDIAAGRRCRRRPGRAPAAFAARDENDLEISAVEVVSAISEGRDSEVTILGSPCHNMQTKTYMLTTYTHRTRPFPAGGKSQAARRSRRGGGEGKRRSHSAAEAAAGVA